MTEELKQEPIPAEPTVTEPEEPAELPPETAEPEPGEERQEAFGRRLEEELRQIRQYEPEVRTPEDIMKLDRHQAILDEVRYHNHTLLEAYCFVYADRIADEQRRQTERLARENRQSKAHLRPMGVTGTGESAVPPEVERNIRAILPRATGREIRDYYRRDARKFRE